MAGIYLSLPPVIDEMLDGLLATGLYGDSREAVLRNLVLDQVKRLAGGRGPMAEFLLSRARESQAPAPPVLIPPNPADIDWRGHHPRQPMRHDADDDIPF